MGKILVVAADAAEGLGRALAIELFGHTCATASSLQEAVSQLAKDSFDLVITDCELEGFDPKYIVKNLKDACPSVLVMILQHEDKGAITGADDYVVIPCSPKELEKSIQRVMGGKGLRILPRKVFQENLIKKKSRSIGL